MKQAGIKGDEINNIKEAKMDLDKMKEKRDGKKKKRKKKE